MILDVLDHTEYEHQIFSLNIWMSNWKKYVWNTVLIISLNRFTQLSTTLSDCSKMKYEWSILGFVMTLIVRHGKSRL